MIKFMVCVMHDLSKQGGGMVLSSRKSCRDIQFFQYFTVGGIMLYYFHCSLLKIFQVVRQILSNRNSSRCVTIGKVISGYLLIYNFKYI